MNDIPLGTHRSKIINHLLAPDHNIGENKPSSALRPDVVFGIVISNSRLDDEQLVATIEISDTPKWLQRLNRDKWGFPKKTDFGTLWKGVDRDAVDQTGKTEFIRAVCKGGVNLFYAEMLAEFPDTNVNVQDKQGRTALHWASVGGHADMVRLCLSVPECAIGLKDNDGFTAFDLSVRAAGGNEMIPNLFYKSMFDLGDTHPHEALLRVLTVTSEPAEEERPAFPGAALFDPVKHQNQPLVEALINRGVNLTVRNEDGDTALHVAARVGNVEIASLLLEAGSDVNAEGYGGATPSQCVGRSSDKRMEQVLRDWEVDADEKEKSILKSRHLVEESKRGVEHKLGDKKEPRNGDGLTPLLQAVKDGNLDTVRSLMKAGANMEAEDGGQRTALQVAARQGHIDLIEILLASGARTDVGGDWKEAALLLAAEYGKLGVVNALLAVGAKVHGREGTTRSPLHLAAANGHSTTVQGIIDGGAQIDRPDHLNETALHDAAMAGHTDIVRVLVENGANINERGDGGTALHMAANNGHAETIAMLLSRGANTEVTDNKNETALHSAAAAGHTSIVQALLDHGAKRDVQGTRGSPMDLALQIGHQTTLETLKAAGVPRTRTASRVGSAVRQRFKLRSRSEK